MEACRHAGSPHCVFVTVWLVWAPMDMDVDVDVDVDTPPVTSLSERGDSTFCRVCPFVTNLHVFLSFSTLFLWLMLPFRCTHRIHTGMHFFRLAKKHSHTYCNQYLHSHIFFATQHGHILTFSINCACVWQCPADVPNDGLSTKKRKHFNIYDITKVHKKKKKHDFIWFMWSAVHRPNARILCNVTRNPHSFDGRASGGSLRHSTNSWFFFSFYKLLSEPIDFNHPCWPTTLHLKFFLI